MDRRRQRTEPLDQRPGIHSHPTAEAEHQMEGGLLLNIIVGKRPAVLQLLPGKDQPLLVRQNPPLILDLCLDIIDGIRALHLEGDRLSREGLHKDLHPSTEAEHQMEGRLFLDVIIGEHATVLKLLAGEDQTLLVRRNTFLILNLGLDVVDRVRALDLQGDRLAGEGLDEDLHASMETEDKVEGRLLLNVIIGEGAAVFQLLAGEDQTLLVWRNTFLILNLGLDVVDRVRALDFQGDRLAGEGLDEDLHASTETEDKVEGGFLLNVIIGKRATVFQLLTDEDQTLLVRGDALFVLDFGLDVVDRVRGLDLQSDGLAGEGLDEDLHLL